MLKQAFTTVAIICALGCGGSNGTTDPNINTPPPPGGISVENNFFSPQSKSVAAGTTVEWAWNSCSGGGVYGGQTCVTHDILFDDGATSGQKSQGTYSRSFATAGTYPYHCSIHGTAMSGSIVVQ